MNVRGVFILLCFAAAAGLLSCHHMLSTSGALVLIVRNSDMVQGCKLMGSVSGASSLGLSEDQKNEHAFNEVRNKAALLGANTVLIVSMDSMFQETVIRGKAYDCPAY